MKEQETGGSTGASRIDPKADDVPVGSQESPQADVRQYLLDTNCFYVVSGSEEPRKGLSSIYPRVSVSQLSILEIARVSSAPHDFQRRKRAMQALVEIGPRVLPDSADALVAKAFGVLPTKQTGPEHVDYVVQSITRAGSHEELVRGFQRPGYPRLEYDPRVLDDWKQRNWTYPEYVMSFTKRMRDQVISELHRTNKTLTKRELRRLSTECLVRATYDERFWKGMLETNAMRAMGITNENRETAQRDAATTRRLEELIRRYDGSLDDYLKVFCELARRFARGYCPEKNLVFDLDFFVELSATTPELTLVTTEPFLCELVEAVMPNRVVSWDELVSKMGLARARASSDGD